MEPIISPWVIYALHVFDKLYFACGMVLMCCVTIAPFLAIFGDMENSQYMIEYAKKLIFVAVVCAIVLVIAPSKDILLTMIATSYITPDNIQLVQGNVLEFIRQISGAVQSGK
jgi:hypothetical protein